MFVWVWVGGVGWWVCGGCSHFRSFARSPPRPIDDPRYRAQGLVVPLDARVGSEVGSNRTRDNIVGAANEKTHQAQQREEDSDREGLGTRREDVQTGDQDGHEGADNASAAASVKIRHHANNYSA